VYLLTLLRLLRYMAGKRLVLMNKALETPILTVAPTAAHLAAKVNPIAAAAAAAAYSARTRLRLAGRSVGMPPLNPTYAAEPLLNRLTLLPLLLLLLLLLLLSLQGGDRGWLEDQLGRNPAPPRQGAAGSRACSTQARQCSTTRTHPPENRRQRRPNPGSSSSRCCRRQR
jgi:hypothetical protein